MNEEKIKELAKKNNISFEQMKHEILLAKEIMSDIKEIEHGKREIEDTLSYVKNAHKINREKQK
jgi:hypothetical protein